MAETLNTPNTLAQPFAENGDKNVIPATNDGTEGLASLSLGLPPITSERIAVGGKAVRRKDINGIINLISQQHYFFQNGGTYTFVQDVSDKIGGYPLGARLWYQDDSGVSMVLRSTKQNNEDNFNTNPAYIGTSWIPESFGNMSYSSAKMFDYKFSDSEIDSMSWVKSDNSWLSSSTYSLAYLHLTDDIGFLPINDGGVVKIQVSCSTYTAGNYTRSSTDDIVISNTTYYAWKYSTDILYVTLNTGSMSADDAVDALQGERIYKYENSDMLLTPHKMLVKAVDSYTINGSAVSLNVLVGSDGHRIVTVSNGGTEYEDVDTVYNALGVAWYYVLDESNTRFKLPRTKYSFNGLREKVGGYIEAGVPNITGKAGGFNSWAHSATGAFDLDSQVETHPGGGSGVWNVLNFNASRCSSVYGNSDTVQPPATEMYLYFYVGGFSYSAISQTAGINAETINGKMDTDASNATVIGKETVNGWGLPDYSSVIDIGGGSNVGSYTPPSNGWIYFQGGTSGASMYYDSSKTNDVLMGGYSSDSSISSSCFIPVKKGYTYYFKATSVAFRRFFPCIGG